MLSRLYYGYRILATGTSFALFGIGGLIAGLTLFPLLHSLPGDRKNKERRAQRLVHLMFRFFVRFMECLWVTRVEVTHCERLQSANGVVFIANHPSLLDVVVMIAAIPHTNCIVKQSLFRNPFTRWVIRGAGYIANDDPDKVIDACHERLSRGDNLIIFPEGTRTTPGQPLKLQRGAAHIILRNRPTVVPIRIGCHPTTLTKGIPWYRVSPQRFVLSLKVGLPWDYPVDSSLTDSRQVRQLTRAMAHKLNLEQTSNESIRTRTEAINC